MQTAYSYMTFPHSHSAPSDLTDPADLSLEHLGNDSDAYDSIDLLLHTIVEHAFATAPIAIIGNGGAEHDLAFSLL
jgi:hypothetical protein